MNRREQIRLALMAMVALAITASLAWTFAGKRAPADPAAGEGVGGPVVTGPAVAGGDGTTKPFEITAAPLFPEEEAREVEVLLAERLREFPAIRDGEVADDPASLRFLVEEVTRNYRVINLRPEGFRRPDDLAAILADPGPHRGRLLQVTGELMSLERGPGPEGDDLVRQIRRGSIRDAAGNWYSFTRPIVNPLEPDAVEAPGGWVRLRGIVYRVTSAQDPTDPTKLRPMLHLVLTESPLRDFPAVAHRDIQREWYEAVRDSTHAEAAVRDEPPFYLLLNMLTTLGPEGFEAWGRAQQAKEPSLRWWPPEDMTGRGGELIKGAATYRFRPVAYTGVLKRPQWLYDLKPNPGNVENLWIGFLVADDFLPVWVYSTRSFADMGFRDGDRVRLEGLFLKRTVYQPKGGKETLQAPVLLLARMRAAPLPETMVSLDVFLVVATVALLMVGALVLAVVQGRREDRDADARRKEKLRRRREKAAAEGSSPVSAADGAPGDAAAP